MIKPIAIALFICLPLTAQEMKDYAFHLENGATVIYQTFGAVSLADDERAFGVTSASGNVIRRAMTVDGKPWLAFELHVDRKPGPGTKQFVLSMAPIGGWAFFKQKPAWREVDNGDRVLLDVLEEPGTGRKVFDTFQIGDEVPMQIMPLTKTIPQMPHAGTELRLQGVRFMKGLTVFAQAEGKIKGTKLAISVPGKGLFVFSSQPEPGFRMEAVAEGPRLRFLSGNDSYEIHCAQPVIDAGTWYLWVKHEESPQGHTSLPILALSIQ